MNPHLLTFLSRLPENAFIELCGATEQLRNGDVYYPFRQDSDFLYLTGLSVPDLVLTVKKSEQDFSQGSKGQEPRLLRSSQGKKQERHKNELILWRSPINDHDLIWGSEKLTDAELTQITGIHDIRDISELTSYKTSLQIVGVFDPRELLTQMRLIKAPDEIKKIRQAITITNRAFERAQKEIQAGMYEYEVEAIFAHEFRKHHVTEAYPTIVASGPNVCTLHYTKNTRKTETGDLILIDAGCEYMGYASDWTRMLIVGEMTPRQRSVLEAVERVKKYAESQMKPGVAKLYYEKLVRLAMIGELEKLGLIDADISEEEKLIRSKIFYPHSTSHFLGLDVHDIGPRDLVFETGMVLTIEPGIYISDERIGVRIEDDYLVTETGCEKLQPTL